MKNKICAVLALVFSMALVSSYSHADDKADVARIDKAWDEVYENIGWLAGYLRELTADGDGAERFDTYKALMSILTDDFLNLVYPDTDRPRYLPYLRNSISNFCAPNTDFKYGMIHLQPGVNYRIWGTRGNAEVIDFQQYSGWPGHPTNSPIKSTLGKYAQGTFASRNIKVDEKGNFEFIFGPHKPEDGMQWWQAEPDGILLMVRDIFLDHTKEAIPARFYIEKVGPKKAGPTTVSVDEAVARLQAFARAMKEWDVCFKFPDIEENAFVVKDWYAKPEASDKAYFDNADEAEVSIEDDIELAPGQLKPPPRDKEPAAQLTQTYHMAFYRVKPGEALIGEWRPPSESLNWNIHLYTRLLQNLGFIDRQTDINTAGAHLDSDGIVRFVVSHNDPGVANWLDVDGRPLGTLIIRCKLCNERGGIPTLKLVAEKDVLNYLPKDTKMITPEERDRILALRRQHYMMRFHQ